MPIVKNPKGFRKLKIGEEIERMDVFWNYGDPTQGVGYAYDVRSDGKRYDPKYMTQYYRAKENT